MRKIERDRFQQRDISITRESEPIEIRTVADMERSMRVISVYFHVLKDILQDKPQFY